MTHSTGLDNPRGAVHGSNGGNLEPDRESRLAQPCMGNLCQDTPTRRNAEPAYAGYRLGPKRTWGKNLDHRSPVRRTKKEMVRFHPDTPGEECHPKHGIKRLLGTE